MGTERCAGCGVAVPAKAFDKGEAVRLLGRAYCAPCMKERVKRSKSGDVLPAPEFLTPRPDDLRKQME
jgi:hypothetical protein